MDLARTLTQLVPGMTVSETAPDRLAYAHDLWPRELLRKQAGELPQTRPRAIAWPRSTEQVVALVQFARREGFKVVPFGAGSGVCGAVLPDERTIVIDLKQIGDFKIQATGPLLDVGPGALGISLEKELERLGYTIGHFPSSILCSTVGGWVAARGAGQCSGRYGKIEDMVAELECVLGSGEVVQLKRRFSAPNLLPLFIGSEGTLGVITRAKLRLHAAPQARAFIAFSFPDVRAGCEAMRVLYQNGLRPAVSRLYDPLDSVLLSQGKAEKTKRSRPEIISRLLMTAARGALRAASGLQAAITSAERRHWLGGATLILMFEGIEAEVQADAAQAATLCHQNEGVSLGEGPARAWYGHRYSVSYRQSPVFRMGAFSDTMEVAAPWSKLLSVYEAVRAALGEHVLVLAHLSHAYPDGSSIYFTFSGVEQRGDIARVYDRAWRTALEAAIDAGATLSHHHGVGRSKAPFLGRELGFGIDVVQRLMKACDPDTIMNPGALKSRSDAPLAKSKFEVAQTARKTPLEIDAISALATASGELYLQGIESELQRRGFSLGLEGNVPDLSVKDWVARGMPGMRSAWDDPVASNLAGLQAQLHSGERLNIRVAPRRAVGPDLSALFVGGGEKVGVIESVTIPIVARDVPRARALPFDAERDPKISDAERQLFDACAAAVLGNG